MLTIKEIQLILKRLGYKISTQTIWTTFKINNINGEHMGNNIFFDLSDVLPFIEKRVQTTESEVKELLKDIRTKLSR